MHALYRGHVIPVAFILLPSKSEQIYQKITNGILQLAPAWQLQRVMMDFEKATVKAPGQFVARAIRRMDNSSHGQLIA